MISLLHVHGVSTAQVQKSLQLCCYYRNNDLHLKFLHLYQEKTWNSFFFQYLKRTKLAPGLHISTSGSCEENPLNSEQAEEINQYLKIIKRQIFLPLWTMRRSNSFIFLLGCFKTPKKHLVTLWSAWRHNNASEKNTH